MDIAFYKMVRDARPGYEPVDTFLIPPYSGRGFGVKAGQTFRVIEDSGPQIGDVAFWSADDPKECFAAMRTWLVEGWIVRPFTRLWSELPWFRPMMTCIEDTVRVEEGADYHYHFIGAHCSPEAMERRFGLANWNGCRLNLLQAIEPFGLGERDLRENVNVHEKNRLDLTTGLRSIAKGECQPGDYIEFYAEMNLIVAVSVCPFGDGSGNPTVPGETTMRALRIEIYDTGIKPRAAPTWTEWRAKGRGVTRDRNRHA